MAQKVLVQLVDDLDGTSAQDVSTVLFGLDDVSYEIDLSDTNAERLRDSVQEFLDAPVAPAVGSREAPVRPSAASRPTPGMPGRSANGHWKTGSDSLAVAAFHRRWSRRTRRLRLSPRPPRSAGLARRRANSSP
jgi:hypothetical protein